ncbi:hypothetical protein FPRO05_03181 [Fusarium proliferatum]|uniref:Uncharacterized protein n=1 Tax=Gibberella intermedia TaxID=948311 RepID=A0A365N0R4_GIBIN|nr:hypothetical protein FPRO05_03181 [Fusarium proliferatum]
MSQQKIGGLQGLHDQKTGEQSQKPSDKSQQKVEEKCDATHWDDTVLHSGEEKVQEKSGVLQEGDAEGEEEENDENQDQDDRKGKKLTLHGFHEGAERYQSSVVDSAALRHPYMTSS